MTFAELVALQDRVRRDDPSALQLAETRIARGLAALRPELEAPAQFTTIHRCDLAREWCAVRGLPASWSPRALVCEGVRHALGLMFGELARAGEAIAIPRDVYPVYEQLAERAGVTAHRFDTFPAFDLARAFATPARHVVVPCPLKLHGRAWTSAELATAADWLARDPARRLILDGVYAFGEPVAPAVLELVESDQVLYLDSMSKGWLHAQLFGAALVPARDRERWSSIFRGASPTQASLFVARARLATRPPVTARLAELRARTLDMLAARGLAATAPDRGYLIALPIDAAAALAAHGVVLIPLSVFGGSGSWSFASALGAA